VIIINEFVFVALLLLLMEYNVCYMVYLLPMKRHERYGKQLLFNNMPATLLKKEDGNYERI